MKKIAKYKKKVLQNEFVCDMRFFAFGCVAQMVRALR